MTADEGMTGRAATFTGGGVVAARCAAIGVGVSAAGVLAGLMVSGIAWWERGLVGILCVPLLAAASLSLWSDAGEQQADFARLRASGLPAVAEVVAMTVTNDGESDWATMTLRISGPDVPMFEGCVRCHPEPMMRLGARLDAVVDPADNLFTLRPV
ncbi:hypothetical protein [Nocardia stercoris]|uniref:Uncharacterized protein n=1 Tax=Nocardia stercoris TaxID=2483361 RepID=A0A3M2KV65_9NOCA|nr:hypothetical protein [Nocardia stercoris]RMI28566.1 hypothetical protein EBN03_29585 [Nocardia stercoris]